jgi:FlaA1/EpsC-like NDP-sugar epimerase
MNLKKTVLIGFWDVMLINISIIASYLMRFGNEIPQEQMYTYLNMAVFVTIAKLLVFFFMGLYKPIWKYAGLDDIVTIAMSVFMANAVVIGGIYLFDIHQVPRSIYAIATLVDFLLISVSRFSKHIFKRFTLAEIVSYYERKSKKAMIIGAGEAGGIVIQQLRAHKDKAIVPVCIIDDDKTKKGLKLNGVPVVGDRSNIAYFVMKKNIDQIIIAIPSIGREQLSAIINQCKQTKCETKILPNISEIQDLSGSVKDMLIKRIRDVEIEDLLGRDVVKLDSKDMDKYINNKVVLVSGGGGSIGSELCRQISLFNPKELIIVDIYENNAYDIQNELLTKYPQLKLTVLIASIRDRANIFDIFDHYRPDVVFHAAAHKHVPLMEGSPKEAIKNNVFGTLNIVQAADQYGVERFVQISTDKAVNPTNVMGASKRLCEMIIQAYASISETLFVAVRFGNVLGSNGSVIPLFKKQIAAGGPVRVTHPDIIRYFMTIPEAVQLVLKAGSMAAGGEIFVLDMGEPVSIDKLARDLISLSGFRPDVDIDVVYTGLRPGEKLYEELLMAEEGMTSTAHNKIHVAKPMDISVEELDRKLKLLSTALEQGDSIVVEALKKVVPTYKANRKLEVVPRKLEAASRKPAFEQDLTYNVNIS